MSQADDALSRRHVDVDMEQHIRLYSSGVLTEHFQITASQDRVVPAFIRRLIDVSASVTLP